MEEMGYHLFDELKEVWRPAKWFEPWYEVSTFGRVRSIARSVKSRYAYRILPQNYIKPIIHKQGYVQYRLSVEGKQYPRYAHRLVAETFLGEIDGKAVIHRDGDRQNNYLNNIEIIETEGIVRWSWQIGYNRRMSKLRAKDE